MTDTVKLEADRDRCIGSGMCLLAVPEVFDQDDDGIVVLLEPVPGAEHGDAARTAVGNCPSGALRVLDS